MASYYIFFVLCFSVKRCRITGLERPLNEACSWFTGTAGTTFVLFSHPSHFSDESLGMYVALIISTNPILFTERRRNVEMIEVER